MRVFKNNYASLHAMSRARCCKICSTVISVDILSGLYVSSWRFIEGIVFDIHSGFAISAMEFINDTTTDYSTHSILPKDDDDLNDEVKYDTYTNVIRNVFDEICDFLGINQQRELFKNFVVTLSSELISYIPNENEYNSVTDVKTFRPCF